MKEAASMIGYQVESLYRVMEVPPFATAILAFWIYYCVAAFARR